MTHVICRLVWADEYKSKKEPFDAGNMKYPALHKVAGELLNFANENGYAYGFVEDNRDWLRFESLGAAADAKQVDGITVIWCALDKQRRHLRVVGWYDNATAYRKRQSPKRGSTRGDWPYQFKTKIEDAHLIPSAERYLEVPTRIKRTDKGYIGQRNWHFPEQHYQQYSRFLAAFKEMKLGQVITNAGKNVDRVAFEEGERSFAETSMIARNPQLIKAAKARYGFNCQVCDFNFENRYGALGKDFIEVHHLLPMSERKGRSKTTTDDVRVVCANCHRMIHHGPKLLEISELKGLLT